MKIENKIILAEWTTKHWEILDGEKKKQFTNTTELLNYYGSEGWQFNALITIEKATKSSGEKREFYFSKKIKS